MSRSVDPAQGPTLVSGQGRRYITVNSGAALDPKIERRVRIWGGRGAVDEGNIRQGHTFTLIWPHKDSYLVLF